VSSRNILLGEHLLAANWNENPTPFVWHKHADHIRERLADYCNTINQNISAST